ncbi:SdpI family protein [Sphingobacterium mizutaii]|uniref:SdpI family protein n=1 Tax=Sphingobacterium mizutaii TaxID=1010 RepID=UPI0035E44F70
MELNFLKNYFDIIFCDLLISFVTVLAYLLPKRKINSIVGYRTMRSMKDQKNWDFSQRFFFRNWFFVIPVVLLFQVLTLILFDIESIGLIETLSMILFFIYSISLSFITERKLKQLDQ